MRVLKVAGAHLAVWKSEESRFADRFVKCLLEKLVQKTVWMWFRIVSVIAG